MSRLLLDKLKPSFCLVKIKKKIQEINTGKKFGSNHIILVTGTSHLIHNLINLILINNNLGKMSEPQIESDLND